MGGLSWTRAVLGLAGASVFWYIISSIVAWYKLRHIPGPFFASFSHIWCFWTGYSGRSNVIISRAQTKYGKLLRVAPDGIAVSDADTLIRINSARSPYEKALWYESARMDYRGNSVISEINTAKHDKRKAKLAPAFTGKNVAQLEANVDSWIAALGRAIRAKIDQGEETMNIGLLVQYFQVDLISGLLTGEAWGDLKDEKDHFGYLDMSEYQVPLIQSLGFLPVTRMLFTSQWFMKRFGPKTTDTSGVGVMMRVLQEEVESRFKENTGKPQESWNILDEWMKQGLPANECQLDLSLLLPAGTETSIMMIRGTLLLLMSSPVAYWKLKQEIKSGIAAGRISNPVTNEEARSLEYTQAVVREGMRMMVPINFGFPKQVPDSGDTICGTFVPGGTSVYINYHSMMRSEDVFGSDANTFRPERFLGTGPEISHMSKVVDLAFGGGRFVCLGKAVANIEINKIFVELLRNFDFQIATPEKPWRRDAYGTWIVHDFWARVTKDTTMG
ncbi:hypothetical protein ANO14919_012970 [Xylariales sp. No.14919]|nr:hypothetical protein ANO14919_012970 [Xylariales sp. No.14919]